MTTPRHSRSGCEREVLRNCVYSLLHFAKGGVSSHAASVLEHAEGTLHSLRGCYSQRHGRGMEASRPALPGTGRG